MSVLSLTILGSSLLAPSVLASEEGEVRTYHSNGLVKFIPDDTPTEPVDPEEPEIPVEPIDPTDPENPDPQPGTPGPLSIDFASSFNFGENKITNKDKIYFARAQEFKDYPTRPNYVQITDKRGTNAGWTLQVKQNGQFQAKEDTLNKELIGAGISLSDPQVNSTTITNKPTAHALDLIPNELATVMEAKKGEGAGTWVNYWGQVSKVDGVDVTENVTLSVPGSTPKDAVAYGTTLTWTLSDTPAK